MDRKRLKQENIARLDDLLPGDLLSPDEQVIFAIKPSLWTIAFLSFWTVVIAGGIALILHYWGEALDLNHYGRRMVQLCGAVIIGRIGFAFLQWLSRSYVLTNKRVIRIRGVFTIDIFQCALPRLQNTFLELTLMQRFLKLGNIAFATAGTAGIEAVWRHVNDPLQVHQLLLEAMNAAEEKRTRADDKEKKDLL